MATGSLTSRDERPIGYGINNTPILSGGIHITLSYKGFDFAADFSGGTMMAINRTNEQRNPYQNTGNVARFCTMTAGAGLIRESG